MTFWNLMGVCIGAVCMWVVSQVVGAPDKPFERTCPDRSATQERLAYSTYHSDGRLECTYIRNTIGEAKRKI